ncbi:MAG TPA: helix-turn-helix domain-containing protein [Mycobacteriales bacterium]|jgi:DNA-binding PucR family transcriptional regulator|nr:helix-turn-helix domain-containing protein [Mycobacteriales bacterium]
MTTTPDVVALSAPADLVRQLSLVAEQFGSLLAELRLHTDERGAAPEQVVLRRVLTGEAGAEEAVAAGLSLMGARLVVASLPPGQVAQRVTAQLRRERSAVAILMPPSQLVALVRGVPHRAGEDRGHRAASRVAALAQREAPGTLVGISSSLTKAEQVRAAYAEASDAATIAGRENASVVFADEAWAQIGLHRVGREACRALPLDNPLTRLRDHDTAQHSNLVETLRAWLTANGETTSTAAALSLHPNSLRYRIKRIQEITGMDLDDADVRALAHVVLAKLWAG